MSGLAVLSQGKYFWMNNGASWYNDYSVYRTKSMRTIANEFAGLIPLELFTYANYPHNNARAQRYNINTSLLAGHGFWGALEFMTPEERLRVGVADDTDTVVSVEAPQFGLELGPKVAVLQGVDGALDAFRIADRQSAVTGAVVRVVIRSVEKV